MSETQENMFEEGKRRDEMVKLQGQVRDKAENLRSKLKEAAAYMSLLKDGPKTVTDVLFRCSHTDLAARTLQLLSEQAAELATLFEDGMKDCKLVAQWETEIAEIKSTLKAESTQGGEDTLAEVGEIEENPDGDDDEDTDDEGEDGELEPLENQI